MIPQQSFHEMWCAATRTMQLIVAIERYCRSLADTTDAPFSFWLGREGNK